MINEGRVSSETNNKSPDPNEPVSTVPQKSYSTFLDNREEVWKLQLNVGLIEDIKDQAEVDLDEVVKDSNKLADIITKEPKKLVAILYVMCEDQITQRGMTPKDFGHRFDRLTLDNASNALIESIVLFYPRGSAGRILAEKMPQILAKMDQIMQKKAEQNIKVALSNMRIE